MGKFTDLTNKRFGKLTVLGLAGRDRSRLLLWHCRCDCGGETYVRTQDLNRGKSTNCGCRHSEVLRERNHKHGMAGSRPHRIWKAMHTRCYNPNAPSYADYGARGIRICDRWKEIFENFWADMQPGYSDQLEIDRIDPNGDYNPDNCRWVTRITQQRNKRNTRNIQTVLGKMPLAELSERVHMPYETVKYRLNSGWNGNEILAGRRLDAE